MFRVRVLGLGLSLFAAASAFGAPTGALRASAPPAKPWTAYEAFAAARSGECVGPEGRLSVPMELSAGGHRYRLEGHRLVQLDRDADKRLRLGVLSATKDDREATLSAIRRLVRRFERLGMDVLVVNGDLAAQDVLPSESLFPTLAASGVLVLIHAGNTESCGLFNRSAMRVFEERRNLINGNWVRVLELDDGVLYTLPGYHDRRFAHSASAARYDQKDLTWLRRTLKAGAGPRIVVAHGPPAMKGRAAIDIALGAGHVGDPALTRILQSAGVRFGIFGHILESGGRASDLHGHKRRRPGRWAKSLFVNAGTANPDPWGLLGGRTAHGIGVWIEIKGRRARYKVLRLPAP